MQPRSAAGAFFLPRGVTHRRKQPQLPDRASIPQERGHRTRRDPVHRRLGPSCSAAQPHRAAVRGTSTLAKKMHPLRCCCRAASGFGLTFSSRSEAAPAISAVAIPRRPSWRRDAASGRDCVGRRLVIGAREVKTGQASRHVSAAFRDGRFRSARYTQRERGMQRRGVGSGVGSRHGRASTISATCATRASADSSAVPLARLPLRPRPSVSGAASLCRFSAKDCCQRRSREVK